MYLHYFGIQLRKSHDFHGLQSEVNEEYAHVKTSEERLTMDSARTIKSRFCFTVAFFL